MNIEVQSISDKMTNRQVKDTLDRVETAIKSLQNGKYRNIRSYSSIKVNKKVL